MLFNKTLFSLNDEASEATTCLYPVVLVHADYHVHELGRWLVSHSIIKNVIAQGIPKPHDGWVWS